VPPARADQASPRVFSVDLPCSAADALRAVAAAADEWGAEFEPHGSGAAAAQEPGDADGTHAAEANRAGAADVIDVDGAIYTIDADGAHDANRAHNTTDADGPRHTGQGDFTAPDGASEISGQLHLPVAAGLRRGLLSGPLTIEAIPTGARVVFRPAAEDYYVVTSSVAVLVVSAGGALLTVVWPLFPKLLPGAPLGAVLALCGWFLVLSRLRGKAPEDFLASLVKLTAA
jgi:hypothetical protein